MTTSATQDTSLQALLTVSHSLSLANDCPNIFLSLLKDNATSRNPALHLVRNNATSCNPALPVVPLSVSRFYSTPQDAISLFFYVLAQTQITATHNKTAHSKTYISKPMQHMQPSFPVQVISEPMQHMQPSPVRDVRSPQISRHFEQGHVTWLANFNCLLLAHRATHSLHYRWLSHWVVHKTCSLKSLYIKLAFVAVWEVFRLSPLAR